LLLDEATKAAEKQTVLVAAKRKWYERIKKIGFDSAK